MLSLKGPDGMVRPFPIQFRLLKQTISKSYLIELSCNPSSNIAILKPFEIASSSAFILFIDVNNGPFLLSNFCSSACSE